MAEYPIEAHGRRYVMEAHPDSLHGQALSGGRPYERHLLEHIYEQDFDGLAVDVGGCIGNHAVWMAAICGLQVATFEPLMAADLRANVVLNGLEDRVTIYDCALGAHHSLAADSGERVLTDSGADRERHAQGRLTPGDGDIPVERLDDFHLVNVCLVKIDVEGMEPDVLRGGEETIRRDCPVLFIEAKDREDHDQLAAILKPWDYRHILTAKTATPVEKWIWQP